MQSEMQQSNRPKGRRKPPTSSRQFNMMKRINTTAMIVAGLTFLLVAQCVRASFSSQQNSQIQATFSTPNKQINITHVTYDALHDTVYLGATDAIFQLNASDLSKQYEHITGPILDNPSCGITECSAYVENLKQTTNVNKVLVIDYQHKKLLSCGSVKQGACRRYELNNISQREDLIPMAVAANDDNSSTYAFIAPARYNYDASTNNGFQQQVLYVGTTYTKLGQSRDLLVPAIGTRLLQEGPDLLKLYENALDSARIDINSHLRDYFLVNYLYGFASSNYIYFVTVQKKATTRDYEELGYHTRLARVCITDSSYNSYTEVDLKCMPNRKKSTPKHQSFFGGAGNQDSHSSSSSSSLPSEYPLLQDAILVDSGSQLLQSLGQNDQSSPLSSDFFFSSSSPGSASSDDSKVLLGVFSSARDHTQHAGEHSALCAFSLAQIEEKFNDNIHNCYTGKMQSRNMEYIAGNVQECPKNGQGGNMVNFCHETLKINGSLPIVSEASLQFHNTTLTAITATSHINTNQKNIHSEQLLNEFQPYNPSRSTSSSPTIPQSPASPHTVVFMGTSDGHLKKVLLNNASNGIEFDDVQLDSSNNPILSDLHLDLTGQHVIAATPYKVMKVSVQNCGRYPTCRECSQSKNPYCGWCSHTRSCTSKSECHSSASVFEIRESPAVAVVGATGRQQQQSTTGGGAVPMESAAAAAKSQLKWISSSEAAGKCIDLQSIVPDKIASTSTDKVNLYIDKLPQSSSGGAGAGNSSSTDAYKCVFDKKEQTVANRTAFGLSCPLPSVMNRPKIQPGKDHVVVELSVRSSEKNIDFLNGKVTFFDCQLQSTCMGCLTADWGCNWCLNENLCLSNTSKCDKSGPSRPAATHATTQTPLITISNASNLRSALSLTTLSSTGLTGGISSTLVQSNQRLSNTINLVNQCPGFDPSLFAAAAAAAASKQQQDSGSIGQTTADASENNNVRKNSQQQFTKQQESSWQQQQQLKRPNWRPAEAGFGRNRDDNLLAGRPAANNQRQLAPANGGGQSYITTTSGSVLSTISKSPFANDDQQQPDSIGTGSTTADGFVPVSPINYQDGEDGAWPMSKSPYSYTVRQEQATATILQKLSAYIMTLLQVLVYMAFASILLVFVYTGFCKLRRHSCKHLEYRRILAKMDTLERSVRNECRIASMSLRSDLDELTRHVDLSGIPLLDYKHHVIKVFFPGINNHPLLVRSSGGSQQQRSSSNKNNSAAGTGEQLPMDYFERLILTKPFLLAFIDTLERQPTFTIRDRVNVASLIMVVLMERLDYATDILRTLLFQLVERSVSESHRDDDDYDQELVKSSKSALSQRASNLLGALPISKRASRAARLGKVVGGSASSLMASTTVAAQMFISRVGTNKTSPLDPNPSEFLAQQNSFNSMSSTRNHSMSTTAFNQQQQQQQQASMVAANTISGRMISKRRDKNSNSTARRGGAQYRARSSQSSRQSTTQAHSMLRRTDSIVEKMLTDWLALNMYEHFHGDIGRSLYMLFEALKCQLERGPVDAISGEAYYSLNEHKLLKEPFIQFEVINLYVIVDTDILHSHNNSSSSSNNNTASLIDSSLSYGGGQPLYGAGDCLPSFKSPSNYTSSPATNTITLAVRVLDCDTISQVKSKILSALYRNSPHSNRVDVDGVELTLRQHQPMHGQSTMPAAAQYSTVSLHDEDYSSLSAANGSRRVNTLKHYGVNDQAVLVLNRCRQPVQHQTTGRASATNNNRTALTDMLDEHYNNPYSEIQYGPLATGHHHHQVAALDSQVSKSWHLVRTNGGDHQNRNIDLLSSDSGSSSHSPSMMLLGNESMLHSTTVRAQTLQNNGRTAFNVHHHQQHINNNHHHQQQQQQQQLQQYYHPSSSSTSSSGNVMDTNSTSANSSSVNVTNLLAHSQQHQHQHQQQPIYCQIESSARSQNGGANSSYYYQVGGNGGPSMINNNSNNCEPARAVRTNGLTQEQEKHIYLTRMLISKGTVQCHMDDFFKTILSAKASSGAADKDQHHSLEQQQHQENIVSAGGAVLCSSSLGSDFGRARAANQLNGGGSTSSGACPPAVKWLFDLLDEAAARAGVADQSVVHAWKSNAFLLRFWVNFIKNPDYIMDVEKTETLDATLAVVAQTLMDSCSTSEPKLNEDSSCNKLLLAKNIPKYQNQVKRFYQDVASMRRVSDQEIVKHMSSLSMANAGRFDTNLALKELCVYAVNYGVELMGALNNDHTCQQLSLSQQLEQCFRSFTLFEAYR